MLNGTKNMVKIVKVYKCGYCINDLGLLYREYKIGQKDKFYANCILLEHEIYGYILVDTGYGKSILGKGAVKRIYNMLNYTYIRDEDTIMYQLKQDGINAESIKYVFISHFHPDHIGQLNSFKNAKIITSLTLYKLCKNDLLAFKEDIPKDMLKRLINVDELNAKEDKYLDKVIDLFGDNSMHVITLDGHKKGQIGFVISSEKIIFVADSCWKKGEIFKNLHLRKLPRIIHDNMKEYFNTQSRIRDFITNNKEYKLICSHDEI